MTCAADSPEAKKAIALWRAGTPPKAIATALDRSTQWVYAVLKDVKKRPEKGTRGHYVGVYLSDAEAERLKVSARKNGRSLSAELRSRL